MPDDAELLRRYAEEKSEAAFTELVRRRIDLVYSVALRTAGGDVHRAQDAAQRVFTDLARKAPVLMRRPVLTGWLYRSARFAASDLVRAERRRQEREAAAQVENQAALVTEPDWHELHPVLDETLAQLNEHDRDALLLRFFDEQPFAAIAAQLRLSEDAARMRVGRALEKMRVRLARRGITSSAAALGAAIAGQGAFAAPAGAVSGIASTAMAAAIAGSGAGAAAWAGLFVMSKIKIGIAGGIFLAALATFSIEMRANRALVAEVHSHEAIADNVVRLEREHRQLSAALARAGGPTSDAAELNRLNARLAELRARPDGVTDATLHPPTNAGRATPAAAFETFCWAVDHHDLDLVASLLAFSDDTQENRDAFMAGVSPAIRTRYETPERLCAAACFPNVVGGTPDPAAKMQVVNVRGDPRHDGQVNLDLWIRTASGREFAGHDRYERRADGWGVAAFSLQDEKVRELVRMRLDPRTGDPILPTK